MYERIITFNDVLDTEYYHKEKTRDFGRDFKWLQLARACHDGIVVGHFEDDKLIRLSIKK